MSLQSLKNHTTYFLFFICLFGLLCISFNSTFKSLKQFVSVSLNEVDYDDLNDKEGQTEKKEIQENYKLIFDFETLDYLYFFQNKINLNPIESKLVSMIKNIQSPPPKFNFMVCLY